MNKVEKNAMLVLSTAHITESTDAWLFGEAVPFTVWKSEYGYLMHVWTSDQDIFGKLPPDLQSVMKFARKHCVDYIMLDRDGEKHEGLTEFDW